MIEVARIKELLHYDAATGVFTWRVSRGTAKAGQAAGAKRKDGYIVIRLFGTLYYAHRLAWAYMTGEWPSDLLDHKSVDPSDNRWATLRAANKAQNSMNVGLRADNTTGFKGVSKAKGRSRYLAQIHVNGCTKYLGTFETKEEAHAAYVAAAEKYFGEFARAA